MGELSSYVRSLLKQGYSDEYIHNYLKDYGYTKDEISQAISEAAIKIHFDPQPTVKHEHHVSKSAIIFLVIVMLGAAASVFAVLKLTGSLSSEALLDFNIEPKQEAVEPGSALPYSLQITNLGDKERFDVTVRYRILKDGTSISGREETFAVSTSTTREKSIPAPNEIGTYELKATARYDDNEATSSFTFKVEKEETEPEPEPETQQNLMQQAREMASTSPSRAKELCLQLEGDEKDDCLLNIVSETNRPEFCKDVTDVEARDNCYMRFITDGQLNLCTEVTLESNQNYCSRAKDVQILSQYSD